MAQVHIMDIHQTRAIPVAVDLVVEPVDIVTVVLGLAEQAQQDKAL